MNRGEPCRQEYRRRAGSGPKRGAVPPPGTGLTRGDGTNRELRLLLCAALAALAAALAPLAAPAPADAQEGLAVAAADLTEAHFDQTALRLDGLVGLALLSPECNLALGGTVIDDLGRRLPLADGITDSTSEWLSGTPSVYGRTFTVDLGLDRAITRVRVLAGVSARRQPEYFMRGYRIEAATHDKPDLWHLLAEERENVKLDVDTAADSTWVVLDEDGRPAAHVGRFVRLTLIRQDRSNWVSLGEIEVYGTGYVEEGWLQGEITSAEPRNVGRMRWEVTTPPGTTIRLQFREGGDAYEVVSWDQVEGFDAGEGAEDGVLFPGREPLGSLQYRVMLQSRDPLTTPVLTRLEVESEGRVVARDVRAWMVPDTAPKGAATPVTYSAQVDVEADDYGIELLRLVGGHVEVDELRVDGRRLEPGTGLTAGYQWTMHPDQETTFVELAPEERLSGPAQIEIRGRGLFLRDRAEVRLAAGSREQAARDGFVNWQNAREAFPEGWTVVTTGPPPSLLGQVEVSPRPFSPFRDGSVRFQLLVGNLRDTGEVTLRVYALDGKRVIEQAKTGRARAYRFDWDGRDDSGRVVEPGLYLYEIGVDAGDYGSSRSGTVVVAY